MVSQMVPSQHQADLTTETVLETYDVKVSGGNCVHECVRPKELAGQALPPLPGTPAKSYAFQLDAFQQEAVNCLERRESVMVAAHTSAGKTVVAEYAIAMALRDKQRIIYTSPIKALSNQKYRDLQDEFNDVGLMTGDVTINPHASCMIMTTEILRSMLYRGSDVSREMAWVVFDEVHYMRDRDRGVVWEEVMILLPDSVRLVFLSATIPNAREFAEWICRIKHQPCHVIYTDKRPVPLQHYLFPAGGDGVYMVVDEKGQFREDNFHKALTALQNAADSTNVDTKKMLKRKGKANLGDLEKIVRMCSDRGYLPLIVFSFSRKECEANAVALKKMDVTDDDEKRLIDEVFNNAIMTLGDEDRELPQAGVVFHPELMGSRRLSPRRMQSYISFIRWYSSVTSGINHQPLSSNVFSKSLRYLPSSNHSNLCSASMGIPYELHSIHPYTHYPMPHALQQSANRLLRFEASGAEYASTAAPRVGHSSWRVASNAEGSGGNPLPGVSHQGGVRCEQLPQLCCWSMFEA